MSHDASKFVDLCLRGDASPDQIDDFVDLWHDGDSEGSLAEFLGLSDKEYALWVETPKSLATILDARQAAMLSPRAKAEAMTLRLSGRDHTEGVELLREDRLR